MVPVSRLPQSPKYCNSVKLPISGGKTPVRLLFPKPIVVTRPFVRYTPRQVLNGFVLSNRLIMKRYNTITFYLRYSLVAFPKS